MLKTGITYEKGCQVKINCSINAIPKGSFHKTNNQSPIRTPYNVSKSLLSTYKPIDIE